MDFIGHCEIRIKFLNNPMTRRRFYARPHDINGSTAILSPPETHHLLHVLRLTPGDEVFVFDGDGNEYRCTFCRVTDNRAELEISYALDDEVESRLDLTLAPALAKGEKFDFIVQKATELGVNSIMPLMTRYADVRLDENQKISRTDRWRRISLESMKQCGRRRLVRITEPLSIYEFMSIIERSGKPPSEEPPPSLLLFSERGGVGVKEALLAAATGPRSVVALIGPEGGWSDDESEALNEYGCKPVTLGPRIMRTETAALVAIALIQHALGDLSTSHTK
jgi:16S rRNA (uracil1498-N3)-methyltransferase